MHNADELRAIILLIGIIIRDCNSGHFKGVEICVSSAATAGPEHDV
jgi:hypothetical protein